MPYTLLSKEGSNKVFITNLFIMLPVIGRTKKLRKNSAVLKGLMSKGLSGITVQKKGGIVTSQDRKNVENWKMKQKGY